MLIYNYQKEFLGIDESDLKTLGFSDFPQLRAEASDFADLFVKTPGFVHNFKHVHWIDFVTCAEGQDESQVIINANGENFKATLEIKTVYLVDNPTQKSFMVNLLNLRPLSHNENNRVASDVLEKPASRNTIQSSHSSDEGVEIAHKPVEVASTLDPYELDVETSYDKQPSTPIIDDIYENSPLDIMDDEPLDIVDEVDEKEEVDLNFEDIDKEEDVSVAPVETPVKKVAVVRQVLNNTPVDYIYNPQVASDELGLPVDLIEEFIQDFINQSYEFKDELYKSIDENDMDHIKVLSHKLKGVAANLRIEDAFEVLATINTSDDYDTVCMNTDTFYLIVDKLAGKEVAVEETEEEQEELIALFSDDANPSIEIDSEKDDIVDDNDDMFLKIDDTFSDEVVSDITEVAQVVVKDDEDDIFLEIDDSFGEEVVPDSVEVDQIVTEDDKLIDMIEMDDEIISVYDKGTAAGEIGIDIKDFNELFTDYLLEANNLCSIANQSIINNDPAAWRKTAITIKGMSDNMRVHDFTSELELMIHTTDIDEAKDAINVISAKLQQLKDSEV